jgi:CheY-like chemotaxis protein
VQEPASDLVDAAVVPQTEVGKKSALVLSIDDDPNALELLELVLKNEGYRLTTARSGGAGLKLAKTFKPDIVTLDVLMTDMDGWDVLAALKANPETREIPVVMLTIVDEATRGYALGAAEYLMKPIERDTLLTALSRVAGNKRKPSVLLVEDDEPTRAMVRQMLDGHCDVLSEAGDGEEGLERLAESRPDVILLDLLMPKVDGFEFLEALRADESNLDIPVIVVTAKDLTAEDHERLGGAVSRVLEKNALGGRALVAEIRTAVRNGLAQRRDTGEDSGAVAAVSAEQDEARDPADEAPAPSRPDGLRILYVEDNEDNIVLLQGRLLDRGYAVSIARNGREGIATARSERPDLILMDMSLPVMNGWDATRELKGDPATAAIPVIGVSAHAMAGDRDSALAAGCDDYVTKPIDIEELIEKARALVKMGDAEQP